MNQPIDLSEALKSDARMAADVSGRSLADQIEFWARLGRAVEPLLQANQVLASCRKVEAQRLSECLASVDTVAGHRRVAEHLETLAFPHYEQVPNDPGWMVRIEADGRRTIGRFVNRQFQPR